MEMNVRSWQVGVDGRQHAVSTLDNSAETYCGTAISSGQLPEHEDVCSQCVLIAAEQRRNRASGEET